MMISLLVLSILQLAGISQGTPYCPMDKKVGDTCYTRVDTMINFKKFDCYQDCTYKKAGSEDGQLYCFKKGPLPVSECGNVRIINNGDQQITGQVLFAASDNCLTKDSNYTVNDGSFTDVQYYGTCSVKAISGYEVVSEQSCSAYIGDTKEKQFVILPNKEQVCQILLRGHIRIYNDFGVEIAGDVRFVQSDTCYTTEDEFYLVSPNSYTDVFFFGFCNLDSITGLQRVSPYDSCVTYRGPSNIDEYTILPNLSQQCEIYPNGYIRISNNYGVAITGNVNFDQSTGLCYNIFALEYTVDAGSTTDVKYFGTCSVDQITGSHQGNPTNVCVDYTGVTNKKDFTIVTNNDLDCKIRAV